MTSRSGLRLTAHGETNVGLVRSGNEDSYHCGSTVFVVADGLGGHAAGEVASAIAVDVVAARDSLGGDGVPATQEALAEALRESNRAVLASARSDPGHAGMATTLTAAVVRDDTVLLAHVGDSRAYLHRDGALRQLTTDHTAAQEAAEAGHMTLSEAARHPARHALVRAIGLDEEVAVDTPPGVELQRGDRLLLCSDGLNEPLDDEAIAAILTEHREPAAACAALVQAALDGGAPDNVTVVVVGAEAA